ncbi:MAG: choice-of-anchor Q domain-containing protein [Kiritimatiellia bacterium]
MLSCCALTTRAADYYAAQNGQTPASPYDTWAKAASNIQDAVNAASTYDTVWVGAGRYTVPPNATNYHGTNVVFINRSLTLQSSNGVPGDTIIDGSGTNRGIAIISSARWTLKGLVISNCFATNWGGGIYNLPAAGTGTLQNCVVTDNSVGWGTAAEGGGIWANALVAFNYDISNCVFRNNRCLSVASSNWHGTGGGAVLGAYTGGGGTLTDCLIENNAAGYRGGGIYLGYETKKHNFERCIIRGNRTEYAVNAIYGGAGVYGSGMCRVSMRNCLLCNNWTAASGGAFTSQGQGITTQEFYNCTIVSNRAPWGGGGIFIRTWAAAQSYNPVVRVYNSIIYSNEFGYNISMLAPTNGAASNAFFYSCSFPSNANFLLSGEGNTTNRPQFANFPGQDFRLAYNSPCINAGTNLDWMTGTLDLDGKNRIRYGRTDMGAFENIFNGTVFGIQ